MMIRPLAAVLVLAALQEKPAEDVRKLVGRALTRVGRAQQGAGNWTAPREKFLGLRLNDIGWTGLVLFGWGCAGHGPESKDSWEDVDAGKAVGRGVGFVAANQGTDGCLPMKEDDWIANHLFGTLGLVQVYAVSKSATVKPLAEKAAAYLASVQEADGGWARGKGTGSETFLTLWAAIALEIAAGADLIKPDHRDRTSAYLAKVSTGSGELCEKPAEKKGNRAYAGAWLFYRARLGKKAEAADAKFVEAVKSYRAAWETPDFFAWTFAALGARAWPDDFAKASDEIRKTLVKNAEKDGSWLSKKWGLECRPVSTALAVAALACVEKWESAPGK